VKEISIVIRTDDLEQVTEILRKHNVGGITFYEINGAGRMKREAIPEVVHFYMTGCLTPQSIRLLMIYQTVLASMLERTRRMG
jgi:nitrogen regulatory protein PII